MRKDAIMDGIAYGGLIGLHVCFGCAIAADVYDLAWLDRALTIGWALSGTACAVGAADIAYSMIRRRRNPKPKPKTPGEEESR